MNPDVRQMPDSKGGGKGEDNFNPERMTLTPIAETWADPYLLRVPPGTKLRTGRWSSQSNCIGILPTPQCPGGTRYF
jgi:hypothetical protein